MVPELLTIKGHFILVENVINIKDTVLRVMGQEDLMLLEEIVQIVQVMGSIIKDVGGRIIRRDGESGVIVIDLMVFEVVLIVLRGFYDGII